MDNKIITASDIEELLSNRFCPPAWAFIPQVRNGTGFLKTMRTADALAMGPWPSRGLHLHGFEIKISKGDWINELKNPEKGEEIAQFCDFWWVVAPKGVVNAADVPDNWGLMIPFGCTVKIIKAAKQLKPQKIDRLFLAAILRRAQETICPEIEIKEAYEDGRKKGKEETEQNNKFYIQQYDDLKERVARFEKSSGVIIYSWNTERIGEAVRMVLNSEHLRVKEDLKHLLTNAKDIVANIEKQLNGEN